MKEIEYNMSRKTGIEDYYVYKGNKRLRFGYTTGTCAAAAAKGAAWILLSGRAMETVELMTPKGICLHLYLEDIRPERQDGRLCSVVCAVRKDAGDDPDTTDQLLIYARVEKIPGSEIVVDGGEGVGRVTLPGLSQKVGEAAINPVPAQMIRTAVREAASAFSYEGGFRVIIFVPDGERIARKTFNPRLGIVGGISILGTTGIVEPMSEKALIESIGVEMKQHVAQGEQYLIVTPGNYGEDYLREHMKLPFENNIKCSNYVGETIDQAIDLGVKGILFIAHIGKFIKVAGGIMNMHSHQADSRMELLCANAIRAGAELDLARRILACMTTDEALDLLRQSGLLEKTMTLVCERIQFYLDHHSYSQITLGAVIFSQVYGYLGQTQDAARLIRILSGENE